MNARVHEVDCIPNGKDGVLKRELCDDCVEIGSTAVPFAGRHYGVRPIPSPVATRSTPPALTTDQRTPFTPMATLRYPVGKRNRLTRRQAVDLFGCGRPQPDPSTRACNPPACANAASHCMSGESPSTDRILNTPAHGCRRAHTNPEPRRAPDR